MDPRARLHVVAVAPEHTVFADGCFDAQVGREVPVTLAYPVATHRPLVIGKGILVGYEIADDRRSVALTVEMTAYVERYVPLALGDDDRLSIDPFPNDRMSFGWVADQVEHAKLIEEIDR